MLVDGVGRGLRLAGLVLVLGLLTGCPGRLGESKVDNERAELLAADPIFADAEKPVRVRPGWEINDTSWRRSEASAGLATWQAPVPGGISSAEAESRVGALLQSVRDAGWTVLHTRCALEEGEREFVVFAYKVTSGVGLFLDLRAEVWSNGKGSASVELRAPNRRDPANPFADVPPGLAVGGSCIERPGDPDPVEEDGTYLELDSSHTGGAAPNPSVR
ncbi:hypothetical protein [Plantactinospora sp. B5E13]|uniref:hypothetical protein n=1 Tax=unclassified Plantactinospora TaxID=2631981 RepID=UPI00325DB20B